MNIVDFDLNLERNKVYKRTDLHRYFGGQQQGGISTPKGSKFILLFTGDAGEQYGYSDGWDENGIFNYTGEGQKGDMNFIRGNLAILNHQEDGKELLLFAYTKRGLVKFIDNMNCVGYHEKISNDVTGVDRKAFVFELLSNSNLSKPVELTEVSSELENLSIDKLREKAVQKSGGLKTPKERKQSYYQRSEAIKRYARARAKGVCEGCESDAPFITKTREPFLEVHHIKKISDGGPDHPSWVVAICPNCHRKAHYSVDGDAFNEELRRIAVNKENAFI